MGCNNPYYYISKQLEEYGSFSMQNLLIFDDMEVLLSCLISAHCRYILNHGTGSCKCVQVSRFDLKKMAQVL